MASRIAGIVLMVAVMGVAGCVYYPPGQPPGGPARTGPPPAKAPSGPQRAEPPLGSIRIVAGGAILNGASARNGAWVYNGDKLTTGPGSSVVVDVPGYGWVQLDEETDPEIFKPVVQGACVLFRVLFGSVVGNGQNICIQESTGAEIVLNSHVRVEVSRGGQSVITVLEGTATLRGGTQAPRVLTRNQQAVLARATVGGRQTSMVRSVKMLSEPELRRATEWRYLKARALPPDQGPAIIRPMEPAPPQVAPAQPAPQSPPTRSPQILQRELKTIPPQPAPDVIK